MTEIEWKILDLLYDDEFALFEIVDGHGDDEIARAKAALHQLLDKGLVEVGRHFEADCRTVTIPLRDAHSEIEQDEGWDPPPLSPVRESRVVAWATPTGSEAVIEHDSQSGGSVTR